MTHPASGAMSPTWPSRSRTRIPVHLAMPVHPCMHVCMVIWDCVAISRSSSREKVAGRLTMPETSRRKSRKSLAASSWYSGDSSREGVRVLTQWKGEMSFSVHGCAIDCLEARRSTVTLRIHRVAFHRMR